MDEGLGPGDAEISTVMAALEMAIGRMAMSRRPGQVPDS